MSKRYAMADMKVAMGILLALGLLVLLLNMASNVSFGHLAYQKPEIMDRLGAAAYWWNSRAEDLVADVPSARRINMTTLFSAGLAPALEPCWSDRIQQKAKPAGNRGFVVVKISNGPHNHKLQVADAVVVAVQLNATLVIPIVKEGLQEPGGKFEDIYNIRHFIAALEGVVRVVGRLPATLNVTKESFTKVPVRVTSDYVDENLRPMLERLQLIVIRGFTTSLGFHEVEDTAMQAVRCLVMFNSLRFSFPVQKLGERVVSRIKEAGAEFGGHFVAVDLRLDALQRRERNTTFGASPLDSREVRKKKCLSPVEVGLLLQNLGFDRSTAIYLTNSQWNDMLDPLLEMFPNTHTKEYSMPFNEENQFLLTGKTQLELAVDLIVCTESDVFIPAIPGMMYSTVAGERIAVGRTNIIVPTMKTTMSSSSPVLTDVYMREGWDDRRILGEFLPVVEDLLQHTGNEVRYEVRCCGFPRVEVHIS